MARKRWSVFFFRMVVLPLLLLAAGVVGCNLWIVLSTRDRVFNAVERIEEREIGVVLGTSKKTGPDTPNAHFVNRLDAAAD